MEQTEQLKLEIEQLKKEIEEIKKENLEFKKRFDNHRHDGHGYVTN